MENTMAVGEAPERVLVIGDDMRIFLAVVRSLGRAGREVHAAPFNWRAPALKSRYVSKVHYLPRYQDDPLSWRDALQDLLRNLKFDLVIPCCDRAILPLHAHRENFAGYRLAIPSAQEMDLLFDKEKTRALCRELGVPVADAARVSPQDTAGALVARFGLPLVLKPHSSYWIDRLDSWGKVWIVDSEPELQRLLGAIPDLPRYLVEEYFEGVGVGVSVLADRGEIVQAFQHRRLREGRGGSSSYRISEPLDGDLHTACEKICAHTGLTGVCMFEFRYNPASGAWILLETNARFWGSMSLPLSLGVNFPRNLYDLLVHGKRPRHVGYQLGIRSRNFVLDGFNIAGDFPGFRSPRYRGWLADLGDYLSQPARWMTGQERSDSFVSDDIMPALWECLTLTKSVAQKLTRTANPQPQRRRAERPVHP